MKTPYYFKTDSDEIVTLQDGVEGLALHIVEDIQNGNAREEKIMRDCRILDTLIRALLAVKA